MMKRGWIQLAVVVLAASIGADVALAKGNRQRRSTARAPEVSSRRSGPPATPPAGPYQSVLLVDAESGRVLFERDPQRLWPPASMVKMMVALLAFEAVRSGEAHLDQPVHVSAAATRAGGSSVFLRAGESFALKEMLTAMLVASANDASTVVSEALAGSSPAMIARMNARARELGMSDTTYTTVNGMPPPRGRGAPDVTSARDLAILARKLLEYPEVLEYSSKRIVPFRRGKTYLRNTNHLIGRMPGADGLKTGYYRQAGFNLTATASRNGMRLIAVVLGCPNLRSRFSVAENLMEWGFANYSRMELVRAGEPVSVDVEVANGTRPTVRPVAAAGSSTLVRKNEARDLHVRFQLPSVVAAPVSENQRLGEIVIHDGEEVLDVIPAVSPYRVEREGALEAAFSH